MNSKQQPTEVTMRFLSVVLMVIGVLLATSAAHADSCEEILHNGVVNQTRISSDQQVAKTFEEFVYKSDFRTHDEAISAGISVGTVVYGAPLKVGGTWTKQEKNTWFNSHAQYSKSTQNQSDNFRLLINTVPESAIRAWETCKITQAPTAGLSAWIQATSPELLVLKVSWNPVEGDNTKPVVKSSEVAGAMRLDGTTSAFKPGEALARGAGANQVLLKRNKNNAVTVVVSTSRGTVSATLVAHVDPPTISTFLCDPCVIESGGASTLTWDVSGATQVTIAPTSNVVNSSGSTSVAPANTTLYTITATNGAGQATKSATVTVKPPAPPVPPKPPTTVSGLSVAFHTNDDDKDDDTGLLVQVDGLTTYQQNGKERFQDHSDHTKPLKPGTVQRDALRGRRFSICISPNGNDTWKFNFVLSGTNSEGGPYSFAQNNIQLSQNNRCASWNLP